MRPVSKLSLVIASLAITSCKSIPLDAAYPAALAGDRTAIISAEGEGCISTPQVGFTFCRRPSGVIIGLHAIRFFAPSSNCERDICTTVRVLGLDGVSVASLDFPKEGGEAVISFTDILKTNEFRRSQEGAYSVLIRIYYENNDGRENFTIQRGLIYLLVYDEEEALEPKRSYTPFHNVKSSRVWAYSSIHDGFLMKWSTAGRSYVGRDR